MLRCFFELIYADPADNTKAHRLFSELATVIPTPTVTNFYKQFAHDTSTFVIYALPSGSLIIWILRLPTY